MLVLRSHPLLCLALALASSSALGCGSVGPSKTPDKAATAAQAPAAVGDEDFAAAVFRLVSDPGSSSERSSLIAGTVARQMSHAAAYFERGDPGRGTAATLGALYLLRSGEARSDMFGPDGDRALAGAIEALSALGDEGRALSLLKMRLGLLGQAAPARAQVEEHLAHLRTWIVETRTGPTDMVPRTAAMQAAAGQALLEPSDATLLEATKAVDAWISRALEINAEFRRTQIPPPQEQGQEAFRALQTGGATLVALYLRDGRAPGALAALDSSSARKVIPPPLYRLVKSTAVNDTLEDWQSLTGVLAEDAIRADSALRLDPDLRDTALFATATQAYRRDHNSLGVAHVLAEMLIRFEMPEAAPLVLGEALGPEPSPVALGGVLAALRDALAREIDAGSPLTARRIFQAAERLLAVADREAYRSKLEPSAASLRHLMAGIEIRSGQVDAARPLLLAALKEEPTVAGYTMLAMIERQVGNEEVALGHARRALELPAALLRVPGSPHQLDTAEAHLLVYELSRDRGEKAQAQEAIGRARELVDDTLQSRLAPAGRVRAERLLGRILDASGDRVGGALALERALTAAAAESPLLGPAMIGTIARALVVRDLTQARATLQRGIDADVEEEDLVYGALWLGFLEQTLREAPDGKVERVLGRAALGTSWTSKLARWARGKLDDASLRALARSYSEKVEAEFYLAMKARLAGDPKASAALARVAQNPLIDLMEVDLARELLVSAGQPPRPVPPRP